MKESRVKSQEYLNMIRSWVMDKNILPIAYCSLPIAHCLLLIAFCLFVLFTNAVEAQLAGKITKVEGRVDILRAGAAAAVPVKMGDVVNVGDILRTKSDGKAEITFIDNTTMTVGPKSRLGIEEYLYKADEEKRSASLKLYRGRTGFQIPKPVYPAEGSKFEMKTRTAVAGVRGTEGILYTDGIERVYVKEGVIEFKNPLGSVTVSKGEVGEVFRDRPPAARPFSEREYQQQEKQVTPALPGRAEAPPAETPPPPPAPASPLQTTTETALLPPPPPVTPITNITLNKQFSASASILDGEIKWFNDHEGTATFIQSGSISGTFNQTILEGGYYNLNMSGSYAPGNDWDPPSSPASDDWFYFFYSGSTSEGKAFYGASVGDIVVSNKSWSGGNMGWIEDGSKKYWYIGGFSGSYTNPIFNNSTSPVNTNGTFSASVNGFFWDGSKPFWEQFAKIVPTLPGSAPEFFVPITETALRTYDISGSTTSPLILENARGIQVGTMSVSISGKGIELTPGSGLFDVNVTGNGSLTSGSFSDLASINGTINATTSITGATVYNMNINGGIQTIDSTTAVVGAHVRDTTNTIRGVMAGKMTATSSTTVTLDAKAIGEVKPGFLLP